MIVYINRKVNLLAKNLIEIILMANLKLYQQIIKWKINYIIKITPIAISLIHSLIEITFFKILMMIEIFISSIYLFSFFCFCHLFIVSITTAFIDKKHKLKYLLHYYLHNKHQ
jgi:hypothetical protein